MEVLTRSEIEARDNFYKQALEKYPNSNYFLVFSFSDYGGSVIDIVYSKAACREGIGLCKDAPYNGRVCILPANEQDLLALERYPLEDISAFSDIDIDLEEVYSELEGEACKEAVGEFLKRHPEFKSRFNEIYGWLYANGAWKTFGWDYCEDELIEYLEAGDGRS